jgi:hypothetical protein
MADMRRRGPEPAPGMPTVDLRPGLAQETLRELAPLLAEEGIDVNNLDALDIDTLQDALNRAVERRNMELFSPVGATREIALNTLRDIVEVILDGDTTHAGDLLDQIVPESPDNSTATVSSCIGIALGLLDEWLSGQARHAPTGLADHTSLPAGHWNGERVGTDILVLARKGRAFRSLGTLLTRQGGPQVLAGSVLALAAATNTWSRLAKTPATELVDTVIR